MRMVREIAMEALDLPPEVAMSAVKLIVTGNTEVKAINHRGIMIYETEHISFRISIGAVDITGCDLSLAELNEDYLRICGKIFNIAITGDVQ